MLLALFQLQRSAVRIRSLRYVAQALDAFGNLHERAELRRPQNLAVDYIADAMLREEGIPDIRLELFDAQRQTAVLGLNAQNHGLDLFALLEPFRGMLHALGPAQIAYVNQAVDAVLDLDERTEIRQVAHAALDLCSGRVTSHQVLPRILLELLHAQGDTAVRGIHAKNHRLHLITRLHQLRRMLH